MKLLAHTLLLGLVWIASSPTVHGQELLKQLEERLRLKSPTIPSEPASKEENASKPSDPPEVDESVQSEPEDLPVPETLPSTPTPQNKQPTFPLKIEPSNRATTPSKSSQTTKGTKTNTRPTPRGTPTPPSANVPGVNVPGTNSASSPRRTTVTPPSAEIGGGGYLGLTLEPIPGGGFGLAVVEVTPQSPAWNGGFKVGDRIIGVAGQAVTTMDQFATEIEKVSPGTPVKFLVQRLGKSTNLVAVLQDRTLAGKLHGAAPGTAIPLNPPTSNAAPVGDNTPYFGVNIADLSEAFRRQFGIAAYRGASVTEVAPGSPAESADLRPGDCIVEFQGSVIQSAASLVDAIRRTTSGETVTVSFYRGRQLRTASVQMLSGNDLMSMANQAVSPDMLTPEYVVSLQDEVSRLQMELEQTQLRLRELEAKLETVERRR